MGKLLALSLACTLAAAVLFQTVLMGPPRASAGASADDDGESNARRKRRRVRSARARGAG
jgi:hypothetical protein